MEEAYRSWCKAHGYSGHFFEKVRDYEFKRQSLAGRFLSVHMWTVFCMSWPAIFAAALYGKE